MKLTFRRYQNTHFSMSASHWSQSLRSRTLDCIDNASVNPLDGMLHFKCTDGRYASMSLNDVLAREIRLTVKDQGEGLAFDSPEALIDAGWVVD